MNISSIYNIFNFLAIFIAIDGEPSTKQIEVFSKEVTNLVKEAAPECFMTENMAKVWVEQKILLLQSGVEVENGVEFQVQSILDMRSQDWQRKLYYSMKRIYHSTSMHSENKKEYLELSIKLLGQKNIKSSNV